MTLDRVQFLQRLIYVAEDGTEDGQYGQALKAHDQQQRDEIARLWKLLQSLVWDCLASDFNEHWESYQLAHAALKEGA